jgi:hypothetical protein
MIDDDFLKNLHHVLFEVRGLHQVLPVTGEILWSDTRY